jgi:hypothetical protein
VGSFAFECDDARDLRTEFRKYQEAHISGGDSSGLEAAIGDMQFDPNLEREYDYEGSADYAAEYAEFEEEWESEEDEEEGEDEDEGGGGSFNSGSTPTAAALDSALRGTLSMKGASPSSSSRGASPSCSSKGASPSSSIKGASPTSAKGMAVASGTSPMSMARAVAGAKARATRMQWDVFLVAPAGQRHVHLPGVIKTHAKLPHGKKVALSYSETMIFFCTAALSAAEGGGLLAAYPWERVYTCESSKQSVRLCVGGTAGVSGMGEAEDGAPLAVVELQCIDQTECDQISADINVVLTFFSRGATAATGAGQVPGDKIPPWKMKLLARSGLPVVPMVHTGPSEVAERMTKGMRERGLREGEAPLHSQCVPGGVHHSHWVADFATFPLNDYSEMWAVPSSAAVEEVLSCNGRDTYVLHFTEELTKDSAKGPSHITWARRVRFHDLKELQAVGLEEQDRLVMEQAFPTYSSRPDEMKAAMSEWLQGLVEAAQQQKLEAKSTAALLSFLYTGAEKAGKQKKRKGDPGYDHSEGKRTRKQSAKVYEEGVLTVEREMKLVSKMASHQHHADSKVSKLRKLLQKVAASLESHSIVVARGGRGDRVTIGREVYVNREPTQELKKRRARIVELLNRTQVKHMIES